MQEALTDNRGDKEAPFTRFGLRRPCPHQVLYFWCRCVQGKHPYPSRTRRLRPERPMVLHWRRCGRAGGRQIKKRITGNSNECPVEINTGIGKRALSETKRNQKDIENLMLTPISREVLLKAGFNSDQSSKEVLGSDD